MAKKKKEKMKNNGEIANSIKENSFAEQEFKKFIIATIGIISNNQERNRENISLKPHKTFLEKEFSKKAFQWSYVADDEVRYIAFWVKTKNLIKGITDGIYPIFYYYEGKKDDETKNFLILSFGKSVKNKSQCDWDEAIPAITIDKYFKEQKIENLPKVNKNKINYGDSQVYKVYSIDNNELLDTNFQNKIYEDFKLLFYYYIAYLDYKTGILTHSDYQNKLDEIIKSLEDSIENFDRETEEKKEDIEEISCENTTFLDKEEIKKIDFPLNTILFGPPGTGKTYNARRLAVGIVEKDESYLSDLCSHNDIFEKYQKYQKKNKGNINFITFHQSYGYEDFIEGIRPKLNSNQTKLDYVLNRGIFKEICDKAKGNKNENFVLVIDEINRGNISKIFGELISLIEPSKRLGEEEELKAILPYSGDKFGVPNNLYIIGTMNSSDKSVANFDNALRRRFNFLEITPQYSLLKDIKIEDIELDKLLIAMNEKIEFLIDKEHLLGQSYFMKVKDIKELSDVFKKSIIPLLEEYFYDDYEKIRVVLGSNKMINYEEKTLSYEGKNHQKRMYKINKDFFENPNVEEFKKIYLSDNEAK